MKKNLTSFVLALIVTLFVAIPAQAATQFDAGVSTITSQQLPSFIPSGAVAMTDGEMSEVRGEGIIYDAIFGNLIAISIAYNVSPWVFFKTAFLSINPLVSAATAAGDASRAFGWEIGRMIAVNQGYPDPGSFYDASNLNVNTWWMNVGMNVYYNYF